MGNNDRNNKNNKNNKNSSRLRGLLTLVAWAVVLVVIMNYLGAYTQNTTNKSSSHEVAYSQFIEMVEQDKVDEVLFRDDVIYITPVEGYTYTQEAKDEKSEAKSYTNTKDSPLTLYTTELNDEGLLPLLKEHKV